MQKRICFGLMEGFSAYRKHYEGFCVYGFVKKKQGKAFEE